MNPLIVNPNLQLKMQKVDVDKINEYISQLYDD